jgi:ribosomal biogenesis protein LAS1
VPEKIHTHPFYSTRSVLQAIATVDTELAQSIKPFTRYIDQMLLKSMNEKSKKDNIPQIEEDVLQEEISELQSQLSHIKSSHTSTIQQEDMMDIDQEQQDVSWKLYEDWTPCPIGTLPNGKVPNLDMPSLLST